MSYSREGRSVSPRNSGPPGRGRRSRSLSSPRRSRSRSINDSGVASNPGNNLYITGLSTRVTSSDLTRVTSSDLERYFYREGKVLECHLVTVPRTGGYRGFAFVTMETAADADRCINYLNRSVLEGRLITVENSNYFIKGCRLVVLDLSLFFILYFELNFRRQVHYSHCISFLDMFIILKAADTKKQ